MDDSNLGHIHFVFLKVVVLLSVIFLENILQYQFIWKRWNLLEFVILIIMLIYLFSILGFDFQPSLLCVLKEDLSISVKCLYPKAIKRLFQASHQEIVSSKLERHCCSNPMPFIWQLASSRYVYLSICSYFESRNQQNVWQQIENYMLIHLIFYFFQGWL